MLGGGGNAAGRVAAWASVAGLVGGYLLAQLASPGGMGGAGRWPLRDGSA